MQFGFELVCDQVRAGSSYLDSRHVEAFLHTKWHLDQSSRLATIDICQNWGTLPPFVEGSWVQDRYEAGRRPASSC